MKWTPSPFWIGQDVYVLGGGPSLVGFNWNNLKDKNVIGCNSAIRLGFEVCDIIFFSDREWFDDNYQDLRGYPGLVVTHCSSLSSRPESWIKYMEREPDGLYTNKLGFNGNSGCGAINLALVLGAKRVLLLGMDCSPSPQGAYHWNNPEKRDRDGRLIEAPKHALFDKFQTGFKAVAEDLPRVFPGRSVVNVNNRNTIKFFSWIDLGSHFPSSRV